MCYDPVLLYCVTGVEITARYKYKITDFVSLILLYCSSLYKGDSNSGYTVSKTKMAHEQESFWMEALWV